MISAAVLAAARSLRTDDETNPEYDRALVELSALLIHGEVDAVREELEAAILTP